MTRKRLTIALALTASAAAGVALWLRQASPPAPRTVVLISIDTLRADHLGCYGYQRPTSPRMDALAREGILFEDVSSPAPWTLPAHASLLTGLYPSRHGLKSHTRYLSSRIPTLASLLSKQGYVTAAVVNSQNLGPRFGLDRGFQEFLYVEEVADQRAPSTRITEQALAWLAKHRGRRLFLFVHYYDVHSDYRSLPEYETEFVSPYPGPADGTTAQLIAFREGRVALGERDAPHLIDLYDAGIRQMDDELGRLLAALGEDLRKGETLLILTSDHGEEFFERGGVLHGRTQFQEVMRVPLLMCGAGLPAARRIDAPVSLLDVMPTILSVLGQPAPSLDGDDLSRLWRAGDRHLGGRYLFGEADHNNAQDDITRAVRHGPYKLQFDRLTEKLTLFDLAQDPGERTDVAASHAEVVKDLRERLRRFMEIRAEGGPTLTLTPEEIEKLRSLGYIR
jgi:arylsulfatase A-like enzyme